MPMARGSDARPYLLHHLANDLKSVQLLRFVDLSICGFVDLRISRFVDLSICGFMDLWICRFADLSICGLVDFT
jgi:hypothetical protein